MHPELWLQESLGNIKFSFADFIQDGILEEERLELEQENPKCSALFSSISPTKLGKDCVGSRSPKIEPEARILDLLGECFLEKGGEGSRTG